LLPLPPVNGDEVTIQRVEARRQAMGYYEPILVQLGLFWKRIITEFDWGYGENIYPAYRVIDIIGEKLPATLMVNLYALIFSVPIGLILGIVAAIKKNKWQDHLISTLVMIVISVPSFVYAVLLQYLLGYKWNLFPTHADISNNYISPTGFYSLIIPILALSFGTIAGFTRYTRAELSEVLTSDYLLLARTKGLTRRQATMRHALRNAMVVIFPMILGEFISILSGSLVIESIFTIPGIGALYVQSIQAQDYNFFMAISAFYTAIGLFAGIIVDLSYGFIDPRIRMGAK
jgi:ABC-type dipeptide/oligopeptide/nickel transport system permease component